MALRAEARDWWAEEERVRMRERVERRRIAAERAASRGHGDVLRRRRRPPRRPAERLGSQPDRLAAWAVAMGVLLLMAAVLSGHG